MPKFSDSENYLIEISCKILKTWYYGILSEAFNSTSTIAEKPLDYEVI